MAKFLTTSGTSYSIEDIIQNAEKSITLITPYLKLSQTIAERLKDADKAGVKITLIYGKEELKTDQKNILFNLNNLELYYFENLHAKCYFNEHTLVLSSMNLHETSQNKNREMGVMFNDVDDKNIFDAAIKEALSIKNASQIKKTIQLNNITFQKKDNEIIELTSNNKGSIQELKRCFPNVEIIRKDIDGISTIVMYNYPFKGIDIHLEFSVVFHFNSDKMINKFYQFKSKFEFELHNRMSQYRIFWNEKWNRREIKVYDITESIKERIIVINNVVQLLKSNEP